MRAAAHDHSRRATCRRARYRRRRGPLTLPRWWGGRGKGRARRCCCQHQATVGAPRRGRPAHELPPLLPPTRQLGPRVPGGPVGEAPRGDPGKVSLRQGGAVGVARPPHRNSRQRLRFAPALVSMAICRLPGKVQPPPPPPPRSDGAADKAATTGGGTAGTGAAAAGAAAAAAAAVGSVAAAPTIVTAAAAATAGGGRGGGGGAAAAAAEGGARTAAGRRGWAVTMGGGTARRLPPPSIRRGCWSRPAGTRQPRRRNEV